MLLIQYGKKSNLSCAKREENVRMTTSYRQRTEKEHMKVVMLELGSFLYSELSNYDQDRTNSAYQSNVKTLTCKSAFKLT